MIEPPPPNLQATAASLADTTQRIICDASAAAHLYRNIALLLIDVQSKYCDPDHPNRYGDDDSSKKCSLIESLTPEFRKAGVKVYAVHFTDNYEPAAKDPSKVDFYRYQPTPEDTLVRKTDMSAFDGSNIHEILKSDEKTHLLVAGFYLDQCVYETVRHALHRNYQVTLLDDLLGKYRRTTDDHSVFTGQLQKKGAKVELSGTVLNRLKSGMT